LQYPLRDWFLSFPHDPSEGGSLACYQMTSGHECELSVFKNVPLETGPRCPTEPCDVSMHVHMADPCVPLGLAGQDGGCL
jgi:hypothetical protein